MHVHVPEHSLHTCMYAHNTQHNTSTHTYTHTHTHTRIMQSVIDANLFPVLIEIMNSAAEYKTRKEAVWAILNATSGGTQQQIRLVSSYKSVWVPCPGGWACIPCGSPARGAGHVFRVGPLPGGLGMYSVWVPCPGGWACIPCGSPARGAGHVFCVGPPVPGSKACILWVPCPGGCACILCGSPCPGEQGMYSVWVPCPGGWACILCGSPCPGEQGMYSVWVPCPWGLGKYSVWVPCPGGLGMYSVWVPCPGGWACILCILKSNQNVINPLAFSAFTHMHTHTHTRTHTHARYLVSIGCIKPLCDMLTVQDTRIVLITLEGLENILKVGEADTGKNGGVNPFSVLIEEAYGRSYCTHSGQPCC